MLLRRARKKANWLHGFFWVLALVVAAKDAHAILVDCVTNPTTALGAALSSNNTPGAIFAIRGMCQQNVQLTLTVVANSPIPNSIITLTNELGNPAGAWIPGDGIQGEVTIIGATTVVLNGISLVGTATDAGLTSNLTVELGGSAVISNAHIFNGQRIGVLIIGNSSALITNAFIENNGIANVAGQNDGLFVADGSTVLLGSLNNDGSINSHAGVVVDSNTGNGISIVAGSRVVMAGGGVGASGSDFFVNPNVGDQIFLAGGSAAGLYGVQINQSPFTPSPSGFAIEDQGGSALLLAEGTTVAPGTASGGILVRAASSLTMNGSTVLGTASDPAIAAVEATGNSNVILAGGNTVGSDFGGTALKVDHASSLLQIRPGGLLAEISGAPIVGSVAAETILGAGRVQEQSTMDLGQGLVSSNPSLTWTGSIVAQQSSSVRLTGGVHLAGRLRLTTGSNGFFDLSNGGANNVDGTVTCPFATVPASHVAGPANVVPAVTVGTSFSTTTSPQCLPY